MCKAWSKWQLDSYIFLQNKLAARNGFKSNVKPVYVCILNTKSRRRMQSSFSFVLNWPLEDYNGRLSKTCAFCNGRDVQQLTTMPRKIVMPQPNCDSGIYTFMHVGLNIDSRISFFLGSKTIYVHIHIFTQTLDTNVQIIGYVRLTIFEDS